jgi:hypothetical protein
MSSILNSASNEEIITGRTIVTSTRNYLIARLLGNRLITVINPLHAALFGAATELTLGVLLNFTYFNNNFIFATCVSYIASFVLVSSFVPLTDKGHGASSHF